MRVNGDHTLIPLGNDTEKQLGTGGEDYMYMMESICTGTSRE